MKHLLLFVAVALFFTSCTASLSSRMNKLADKVEKKCTQFSTQDWEEVAVEFKALVKEYYNNYDSYSSKEKAEINEAIGRVSAAALKCGAQGIASSVLEEYPLFDGLLQGAKGFLDGLFN